MAFINFDTLAPVERAREFLTALRNESPNRPGKQWRHFNGKNQLCDPKSRSRKSDVLAKMVLDDLKHDRLPTATVNELKKLFKEGL
jgi:hypothetical protein